ncbi:hypothetical protein BGW80DRAFT_1267288 [Lactifluus volemus]|jgi:hypothetical protein|nr:hypothetical protein BGW80DRAFT_1267288 [Lactifluus volemus]
MDTHCIHAALAGLLLTLIRMPLLFTIFLRRVPVYLPISLRIYKGLLLQAGYLEDAAGSSRSCTLG